ncbi:hypothetical protein HK57_00209 [Aspergillus ustus]|uniref:Uncharacterized protein n=1 Tax=Aspergillus ustus TaxID=40382 RepID=A0A0C1C2T5_ASPUT|nr:hypothetical protein HK57_00209 [Aspergillus ustus]
MVTECCVEVCEVSGLGRPKQYLPIKAVGGTLRHPDIMTTHYSIGLTLSCKDIGGAAYFGDSVSTKIFEDAISDFGTGLHNFNLQETLDLCLDGSVERSIVKHGLIQM